MPPTVREQKLPNGTKIMGASKKKQKYHGEIVGWGKQGTFWRYEVRWTHKTATAWEMPRSLCVPGASDSVDLSSSHNMGASASTSNLREQILAGFQRIGRLHAGPDVPPPILPVPPPLQQAPPPASPVVISPAPSIVSPPVPFIGPMPVDFSLPSVPVAVTAPPNLAVAAVEPHPVIPPVQLREPVLPPPSIPEVKEEPQDPDLAFDELAWERVDGVPIDNRRDAPERKPQLLWSDGKGPTEPRTYLQYFQLFFPLAVVLCAVKSTSIGLAGEGLDVLTVDEFWNWLGYLLAMTVVQFPRTRDYWSTEDFGVFQAPNFGRLGMTRLRFEAIKRHLSLTTSPQPSENADRWFPIRPFLTAFNACRQAVVFAGEYLCVDESFSMWLGKDGAFVEGGMPHVQRIERKPEGVGAELKNIACAVCGIMLGLEIQDSATEMDKLQFNDLPIGKASACTLRLASPWFGTWRTVVGDSGFASVELACLLCRVGLYFIGCVKTCVQLFPLAYFLKQFIERGSAVFVTCLYGTVPLLATAWQDKTLKTFISTCGTTNPTEPIHRKRQKQTDDGAWIHYVNSIPCVNVVASYYKAAIAIDVHNHYRQGSIGLERVWTTAIWWHRVFATLFTICVVDAFRGYNLEKPDQPITLNDFVSDLAFELINVGREEKRKDAVGESESMCSVSAQLGSIHEHPVTRSKRRKGIMKKSTKARLKCQ